MPTVRVRFSGPLKVRAGVPGADLDLDAACCTVAEALHRIRETYGEIAGPTGDGRAGNPLHLRVFLNGRAIQFQGGMSAELADGDELLLMLPIGGG